MTKTKAKKCIRLTIADKLHISNFIPKEGNEITMLTAKDLIEKLSINDVDREKGKITNGQNGYVTWDPEYVPEQICLTEAEVSLLKDQRSKLDKQGKITLNTINISIKIREL